MRKRGKGGKRIHSSTTSEFDTSFLEDIESPIERKDRKKKKKKADTEQKTLKEFFDSEDQNSRSQTTNMEAQLNEINEKLSDIVTKNDNSFIRKIVKETLNEMKQNFLESVIRRLEILEGEIHTKDIETKHFEQKIKEKDDALQKVQEENQVLKQQIRGEISEREKNSNESEQYSRRNNVRISGIPYDKDKQQSAEVASLVVKTLNDKGGLTLNEHDIDISHRLGRYTNGRTRTVIVRFVRRQTKINVMKRAKNLKTNKVFVNEDLTHLNQQVLSSLRLKDKDNVTKCWSFEGKIFATFKNMTSPTEIKFKDYSFWLDKPWPKKS